MTVARVRLLGNVAVMDEDQRASRIAHAMLAAEGTGPAWNIRIEEVRAGYARVAMEIRADMLNGHGSVHGGMIFALADTAFSLPPLHT